MTHPMDWSNCPIVEVNPRKVSGVAILKGTRVQADSIVENYEGGSPIEEIAENFAIPEQAIRETSAIRGRSGEDSRTVTVLFDHNVLHKLRRFLPGHAVSTADEMGWAELENGELLSAAESAGFVAFVTADKNLSYQQNLIHRKLAIVVLSTNNWNIIYKDPARVLDALHASAPGSFQYVQF